MRLKYRLRLAIDNMLKHVIQFIGSLVLSIFVIVLFSFLILMNVIAAKIRPDLEASLSRDLSDVGYIYCYNINYDNPTYPADFKSAIAQMDSVHAVGCWQLLGNTSENLSILREVQSGHPFQPENKEDAPDGFEVAAYVETIVMDESAWGLFDFQLYQGTEPDQIKKSATDDNIYIYLGYAYKDVIQPGTVIEAVNEGESTYVVAGILQRGETIADESIYMLNKFNLYSTLPLDYAVIEMTDVNALFDEAYYFMMEDGYSYENVERELQGLSLNYSLNFEITNLGDVVLLEEKSMKDINYYLLQLILVIGFTSCVVLTCIQTMELVMRKSEYGILYACGATEKDIVFMIVIENVVRTLVALLVSIPILYFASCIIYGAEGALLQLMFHRIFYDVLPVTLIVGAMIVILSSILPIYTIKKYTPVMLIGGDGR